MWALNWLSLLGAKFHSRFHESRETPEWRCCIRVILSVDSYLRMYAQWIKKCYKKQLLLLCWFTFLFSFMFSGHSWVLFTAICLVSHHSKSGFTWLASTSWNAVTPELIRVNFQSLYFLCLVINFCKSIYLLKHWRRCGIVGHRLLLQKIDF